MNGPIPPEIHTERLVLRAWRDDDLAPFAAMMADPEVTRWLGSGQVLSRDEAAERLAAYRAEWAEYGTGRWAVEERATGKLVGYGGILIWHLGEPEATPEVVYGFAQACWGRGFATEVARAAIDWAFEQFPQDSAVGLTHPDNAPSQHVLAKLGMVSEGEWRTGKRTLIVHRVSRETWQARQ